MSSTQHFFNEFDDDFTAFYWRDDWTIGMDDESNVRYGVVIRMLDLPKWMGDEAGDQKTSVDVLVVPIDLTGEAYETLTRSCGDFGGHENVGGVLEACVSYGIYAHVTRQAAGATFQIDGPHTSLESVMATDDYDSIAEWIKLHGEKVASALSVTVGFALDSPQNLMGESGWDWLRPHVPA